MRRPNQHPLDIDRWLLERSAIRYLHDVAVGVDSLPDAVTFEGTGELVDNATTIETKEADDGRA